MLCCYFFCSFFGEGAAFRGRFFFTPVVNVNDENFSTSKANNDKSIRTLEGKTIEWLESNTVVCNFINKSSMLCSK